MPHRIRPSAGYAALLFDMDGTLLLSTAVAERIWTRWATRHGIDVARFLPTIHGVRAVETIGRAGPPGIDAEAEAARVTEEEIADVAGIVPLPGAAAFLATLPPERWAIVTSAPRALALARMAAAGIAPPRLLVTAEDVANGKPAPDCYRRAAAALGVDPARCLVFEDAVAGIASAEAAGCDVIVVGAAHPDAIVTPHPVIGDYHGLTATIGEDGLLRLVRA